MDSVNDICEHHFLCFATIIQVKIIPDHQVKRSNKQKSEFRAVIQLTTNRCTCASVCGPFDKRWSDVEKEPSTVKCFRNCNSLSPYRKQVHTFPKQILTCNCSLNL